MLDAGSRMPDYFSLFQANAGCLMPEQMPVQRQKNFAFSDF
jgi:hypothetical protein